jgi:hypothetical protein
MRGLGITELQVVVVGLVAAGILLVLAFRYRGGAIGRAARRYFVAQALSLLPVSFLILMAWQESNVGLAFFELQAPYKVPVNAALVVLSAVTVWTAYRLWWVLGSREP